MSSEESNIRLKDMLDKLSDVITNKAVLFEFISNCRYLMSLHSEMKIALKNEIEKKEKEELLSKGIIPMVKHQYAGGPGKSNSLPADVLPKIHEAEELITKKFMEMSVDLSKLKELIEEEKSIDLEDDDDPDIRAYYQEMLDLFSGTHEDVVKNIIEKTNNPGKLEYYESYSEF
jgi:hypothetical protein